MAEGAFPFGVAVRQRPGASWAVRGLHVIFINISPVEQCGEDIVDDFCVIGCMRGSEQVKGDTQLLP